MKKALFIVVCALLFAACKRPTPFSEIPYIEFVGIEKIDNGTGVDDQADLTLYFHDGDGDIGLESGDTSGVFSKDSAFYYNLFIHFYEKQHGEWVQVELPTPLHARLPYLSHNLPESIEGNITITTFINNYFSPYDTIKLSCQLVDRALHTSNIVETTEIIVKK